MLYVIGQNFGIKSTSLPEPNVISLIANAKIPIYSNLLGGIKIFIVIKFLNFLLRVATLMQKQNPPTFHWLFPEQIQFFTDPYTVVLKPICLLAAIKWQIPFTSSLKWNK